MDSKKTIENLSKKALERIQAEKLGPTPSNYKLWYVYYKGVDHDIIHALDLAASSKKGITEAVCAEIYQQYLDDTKHDQVLRQAGDKVSVVIKDISQKVSETKKATHEYSGRLENVTKDMQGEKDIKRLEDMLSTVVNDTKELLRRNEVLEKELDHSTEIMQNLQQDLEYVRKEAVTDSLTGLLNRKALDREMSNLTLQYQETQQTFTVLMLDIDMFKSFNDNFGHQVGDQVLRLVARTLKDGVRGKDIVARYGGEEFTIILPETSLEEGAIVANNLRKTMAKKDIINRATGAVLTKITISIGVSEYIEGETEEDVIVRADKALYEAKASGRNCVKASLPKG